MKKGVLKYYATMQYPYCKKPQYCTKKTEAGPSSDLNLEHYLLKWLSKIFPYFLKIAFLFLYYAAQF